MIKAGKVRSNVEKRRLVGVSVTAMLSVLSLLFFGFLTPGKEKTTFGFVLNNEWVLVKEWVVSSQTGARIFSLLAIAASVLAVLAFRKGAKIVLPTGIASFGLIMSFLTWVAAGKFIPLTGLLQGSLLLAVPLIFGSMS